MEQLSESLKNSNPYEQKSSNYLEKYSLRNQFNQKSRNLNTCFSIIEEEPNINPGHSNNCFETHLQCSDTERTEDFELIPDNSSINFQSNVQTDKTALVEAKVLAKTKGD